jgi:hypothetical protein
MNLHLGVKPYSCPQCSAAFLDKSNLNVHIKRKHQKEPQEIEKFNFFLKNKKTNNKNASNPSSLVIISDYRNKNKKLISNVNLNSIEPQGNEDLDHPTNLNNKSNTITESNINFSTFLEGLNFYMDFNNTSIDKILNNYDCNDSYMLSSCLIGD